MDNKWIYYKLNDKLDYFKETVNGIKNRMNE